MPIDWAFEGAGLYTAKVTLVGVALNGIIESRVGADGWDWEVWQPSGGRLSGFASTFDAARTEAEAAFPRLVRGRTH